MSGLRRSAPWFLGIWIVATAALAPAALRAADWPVKRGVSHEPVPYKYVPEVWKEVPRDFLDDAPACTLYAGTTYLIEADGTVETIVHEITRLNGRKGIDKLGEYKNISYDPSYEELVLNEARVIKAGGASVAIEPRHVQLRDISTDYQVYDHEKQLIISFPHLEVGDSIEVKWTVRGKNPEYHGQFFSHYNFGDDHYPVVRDELRVRTPKGKELKHSVVGGKLEPEIQHDRDTVLYRWHVNNRHPLPQDDDLPAKDRLRLQVAFSTFPSWEEIAKWKTALRKDCWECDKDIRELVKQLTKDLKAPLEKARVLTLWVRSNIRYVSVGETHAYTPHKPPSVFASRFGDCKDQSQLLAVMLKEAGIPVGLVTLGTRGDGQVLEDVPSPWGTHAILLVQIDGKDHWIDTTVNLAGWDFLPHDDRDRACYVYDEKGAVKMARTPPLTAKDHLTDQVTRMTIRADGSSLCERTASYHGSAALSQRDSWVEVPPGERRRLTTAELQDANSKTRLIELAVDEKKLMSFDEPVSARLTFEIPAHFTGETTKEGSVTDSKVWGRLLSYNLDYDRTVPLEMWSPFESHHRYVIHLSPMYRLDSIPESYSTESKWGTFKLKVVTAPETPHKIELDFYTRIDETLVNPEDFADFRKFHDDVNRHYRVWLELKPSQEIDDALGLEVWQALNPADSVASAALARIYLHHDRKDDARRILDQACTRTPKQAELWELRVRSAETLAEEEHAYRTLVRLFPDEPKYAVALGSILVQRGQGKEAQRVLEAVAATGTAVERAQAHYHLARIALEQEKLGDALDHLQAAEDADAESVNNAHVQGFKGRVLEKLGKNTDAIDAYQQVLKHEADSTEALVALVRLSLAAKKQTDALTYLRRYTLAVGDDVDGQIKAAEFHLRLARFEDAFELASRAADKKFDERSQAVMGLVYLHRDNLEKAVFHLERAELDSDVVQGLLISYVRLDRLRDADDLLPKADKLAQPSARLLQTSLEVAALVKRRNDLLREAKPTEKVDYWRNAISHYVCAERAFLEGEPVERIAGMLNEAFAEGVDYGLARSLRGQLSMERGRLALALEDGEKALAQNAQDARGYFVRGRVRQERGTTGALADLEKAVQLSQRKDALFLHWLALAQSQANQREAALATQREAAKIRPGDKMILEQLKLLGG